MFSGVKDELLLLSFVSQSVGWRFTSVENFVVLVQRFCHTLLFFKEGGFIGLCFSHSWHFRENAEVNTAPTDSLKRRIAHLVSGWLL